MEVKAGAARSLDSSTRSIMNRRPGCDANSLRGRRGRTGWGSRPCRSTRFEDLASTFADECGIVNNREVEIIVDVLTNPASGFVDRKLAKNLASIQVRELDTEEHIRPVAAYLRELGATREQIRRMMVVHPPVCVYDVEDHLRPLVAYLGEVGVGDVVEVLTSRPSLLGLRSDENLTKIVEWLQADGYSKEEIVEYLRKSL